MLLYCINSYFCWSFAVIPLSVLSGQWHCSNTSRAIERKIFVLEEDPIDNNSHLVELPNIMFDFDKYIHCTNNSNHCCCPGGSPSLATHGSICCQWWWHWCNKKPLYCPHAPCTCWSVAAICWWPYQFWTNIIPITETNRLTNSCQILLHFFQLSILCTANNQPAPVMTAQPMPLVHHPTLLCHFIGIIAFHFPMIWWDVQTHQHNLVVLGLGVIVQLCTSSNFNWTKQRDSKDPVHWKVGRWKKLSITPLSSSHAVIAGPHCSMHCLWFPGLCQQSANDNTQKGSGSRTGGMQ